MSSPPSGAEHLDHFDRGRMVQGHRVESFCESPWRVSLTASRGGPSTSVTDTNTLRIKGRRSTTSRDGSARRERTSIPSDLVVVQDLLPLLPGLQVVRQARRYAPIALIAAHLLDSRQAQPFLSAGADVAFSRLDRPGEIAEQLVALLRDRPSTRAVR